MENFIVTTFYKFVELPNYKEWRAKLLKICNNNKIKGTILLAEEGLNSTLTGTREAIYNFYQFMNDSEPFKNTTYKESVCDVMPFKKLKVKLKKEIVTFGQKLDMSDVGEYVPSEAWDKLIADENTMLIDTRNDYEVIFGTFKGAINPKTRNFTDLVQWAARNLQHVDREKPIAMFCTGGVRCEKSTSFFKKLGFKNVFHLKGGILQYFMDTKNKNNNWLGRCFVFDDRIAVDPLMNPYNLPK